MIAVRTLRAIRAGRQLRGRGLLAARNQT